MTFISDEDMIYSTEHKIQENVKQKYFTLCLVMYRMIPVSYTHLDVYKRQQNKSELTQYCTLTV